MLNEEILLDINDFKIIKKIGKGGYSEVFLGKNEKTQELFAIKKFNNGFTKENKKYFIREINILSKIKHNFIVKIVGYSKNQGSFYIIMDYINNGTLFKAIHSEKNDKINDGTIKTIIAMLLSYSMAYLHKSQIIHRDLKSTNILLDENYYPYLCDFGISRSMDNDEPLTRKIGNLHWMAPEVLSGEKYSYSADVYSFGMILYELLTNSIPWDGIDSIDIENFILNKKRPKLPEDISENLRILIKKCWNSDPNIRPTFEEILLEFLNLKVFFPKTNSSKIIKIIQKFNLKIKKSKEIESLKGNIQPLEIIKKKKNIFL